MSEFRFKQFTIQQARAAMKVGTDGVLLGAWASVEQAPDSILDIGAGTGLLSLMLAQRSDATVIDAVELLADAFEECVYNFEASPWSDRIFCYHCWCRCFFNTNLAINTRPNFRRNWITAQQRINRHRYV